MSRPKASLFEAACSVALALALCPACASSTAEAEREGASEAPGRAARVVSARRAPPVVVQQPAESPRLAFERGVLDNGLDLVVIPRAGSPVTALGVVLAGGTALDGERPGESLLSHSLHFGQGSGTEREDLVHVLAESGADFGMRVLPDHVTFSIVGLDTQLSEMVDLLAGATIQGALDAEELESRKNAMVDDLWEVARNPVLRAQAQLPELAFGPRHPYGHAALGSRRTLGPIDLEAVRAHLARTLCPDHTAIVVAGPLRFAAVKALVVDRFGDWRRCGPVPLPDVSAALRTRSEVRIVHDPERKQVLAFASVPVPGLLPAQAPLLEVTGALLGGSLSSRLQVKMRGLGGFTYGVQCWTAVHRGAGEVLIQTALDAQRIKPALAALLDGIQDLAEHPPTDEELARAEKGLGLERAQALRSVHAATTRGMAALAAGLPLEGAPFPTRDAVARFAAENLRADRVQLVLVGDGAELSAAVEADKLGTPRVLR